MKDFESAKKGVILKKLFFGYRIKICFYREDTVKKHYYSQLFFNFESIVETICRDENLTKKELLNLKGLGAKVALPETRLVDQTRKFFFENNNIYLDNLTGKVNKKVLIVRNNNLLSLNFKNCRAKIAPSKCLASLEFTSESEAINVYYDLQYKRIKDKTIYVDYLPISKEITEK